jgi:hypothetical protein
MSESPSQSELMRQLEILAESRSLKPPGRIIADALSALEAKKPKRPRFPYWLRGD